MNPMIEQMHQHRSIRNYLDKPVPADVLDCILKAAWHGPTSINGQQVSLVVVEDAGRRKAISQIAGGQPWIAQAPVFVVVVADFYKTQLGMAVAGEKQVIHESLEGFTVGAIDAGIALGNLMTAARAAGLGVVPIGGIRRDPEAMINLLDLPPLTFPLAGVAMGYAGDEGVYKPRMAFESFAHRETYQAQALPGQIRAYDLELTSFWSKIGRDDGEAWSKSISAYYRNIYFPKVAPVARKQGFGFDK